MNILILELPGSGKTTVDRHLADELSPVHIESDVHGSPFRNCFLDFYLVRSPLLSGLAHHLRQRSGLELFMHAFDMAVDRIRKKTYP